jgi:hypothetical protein
MWPKSEASAAQAGGGCSCQEPGPPSRLSWESVWVLSKGKSSSFSQKSLVMLSGNHVRKSRRRDLLSLPLRRP